jgi:tetratricopeptide (TPR) repeat protein
VPDVEAPELELDEDAPAFRRRLALVVVLITLFGAVIAYLHEQNSNFEDNAARDAQIASIRGFGEQVQALSQFGVDYDVFVQRQLLERRAVVASARQRSTLDNSLAALYSSEGDRFTQLRDAIGGDAAIQDDQSANQRDGELETQPDLERLRQKVFATKSNDYGDKADAYVALLTVLAVSLFLTGLSLTLNGRGRYLLAIPGVAIAAICVGWAVVITLGSITKVSDNAISLTVDGQRALVSGDAQTAVDRDRAAVEDSPQFATAWARLADAEFLAGAKSSANSEFLSLSDEDATKRAIEAGEKAISLGEGDASLLSSVGFYHFTVGEYERAEDLSQQALEGNDQFPPLVFNLGVVQVARGEESEARETYRRGIELLADRKFQALRQAIIGAARTDLEIAVNETPDSQDLANEMKGLLADAEGLVFDLGDDAPDSAPDDASVNDLTISTDRFRLFASYTADGFDDGTFLTNVWYFRPLDRDGKGPFEQIFTLDTATSTGDDPVTTVPLENGPCLPGGDYRVEVYAGHDLVGTTDQHIDDSPLGTLVVDGGDDFGFTLCRPDNWTPPPPEVTLEPGSLAFANPDDPTQFVLVFTFPIGAGSGADGPALLNATIQAAVQDQQTTLDGPPESGEQFLGRTVEGSDVPLATTTVTGTNRLGDKVMFIGSVGVDDVVRMVVISAGNSTDLETVRSELVNSIRFLRVPDRDAANGG